MTRNQTTSACVPASPDKSRTPSSASSFRRAFTIMELMVSIGILVLIILAVGVTFSGASNSVGTSQAVMEEMASVRATQGLIERNLQSLDKNGFLVIRSRLYNTANPALANITYRFDQLSFLANGAFSNRSGADTNNSPFTDGTQSNSAHIWWGQLIMEKNDPAPSFVAPNQAAVYSQNTLPTGAVDPSGFALPKESDFMLGCHVTMLVPGPADGSSHVTLAGNPVMAYSSLDGTTNTTIAGSHEELGIPAHITSGRYATVAETSAQVMQDIIAARAAGNPVPESSLFTYRFHALSSVYDTEVADNPFVNGYFRTTPQVMGGVSSFKVEWTDGAVFPIGDPQGRVGQVKWYGPTLLSGGNFVNGVTDNTAVDNSIEQFYPSGNTAGDHYVAIFSYMNRSKWPKALRITMRVYSDRLGGRDFVQVVNLPQ